MRGELLVILVTYKECGGWELVREAQQVSFREYVEARRVPLLRLAFLLCGDHGRAEDMVQDVLAKAYLRWAKLEPGGADAYVRQMIVNRHADYRRRSRWREVLTREPPDRAATADATDAVDAGLTLVAAMSALSPSERLVVAMRFYLDLSEVETAAITGIRLGTVKSTTARALAKLRTNPALLTGPVEPDTSHTVRSDS
jgi:RNA polymerase sigma-70 factor (sigma-E family)